MFQKFITRNATVFASYLGLWFFVYFIDEKLVKLPQLKIIIAALIAAAAITFLWSNIKIFSGYPKAQKYLLTVVVSLVWFALWLFTTIVGGTLYYSAIGGDL